MKLTFDPNYVNAMKDKDSTLMLNPSTANAAEFKSYTCAFMLDVSQSLSLLRDLNIKLDTVLANYEGMISKINGLEVKVIDLETAATAKDAEILELTTKVNNQELRIKGLEEKMDAATACAAKVNVLDKELVLAKSSCLSLERYTRSFNLRFLNIPENPNEKTEDTIKLVNRKIKDITGLDIPMEYGHRSGAKTPGSNKPRCVIARFASRQDKRLILSKRKNFFENNVPLFEDLPPADLEEKRKYAEAINRKFLANHKVAFRQGHWICDGVIFRGK